MNSETSARLPRQTALAIDFVIIGAGMTGLACAIALRRVGHRVFVIEQKGNIDVVAATQETVHMYPNITRIFYHWGFRDALRAMTKEAEKAATFSMRDFATGNIMGVVREQDENTADDIVGELLCVNHGDLLKYLYGIAISLGAHVRFSAQAVAVDGGQRVLTLSSGETLYADVVIGTDLHDGVTRSLLLKEQDADEVVNPTPISVYYATIPKELVRKDSELEQAFYGNDVFGSFLWLGKGLAARMCPAGLTQALSVEVFQPWYEGKASHSAVESLDRAVQDADPLLKRICALARVSPSLKVVPFGEFQPLDDWVCENGHLLAIGNAAYPFYSGAATGISGTGPEDSAVLAKLFSHLSRKNQITDFLNAFHDLRHPRCEATAQLYRQVMAYFMGSGPPPKETAPDAPEEAGSGPTISEGTDVWWYDAEDHAEEWWVAWGLLKERSIGAELDVSPLHVERTVS
ncbi:hypothetical protein C8R44DRAFT_875630 [Mycena epipterygia]|nr:hypothetical protein C8R44DRAFT_875630 [Mycena epipterygia]